MKLSEQTVKVLKNYATINQGLVFKQGNVITTMSPQKNILSEATVPDSFPKEFGIYNLNEFLSVLSMSKDVEIDFGPRSAKFKFNDSRSIDYRLSESSLIVSPPDKKITLPSVDVEFTWSEDDIAWIQKTASILGSPNVGVVSDGEVVSVVSFDASNADAHATSIELDIPTSSKYRLIFKTENLKLIPGSYTVQISSKGIAHFKNTKEDLEYWIATETGSSYGN
jgi:hypothetical protein